MDSLRSITPDLLAALTEESFVGRHRGGLTLKRVKTSKLCGGSQDESTIDRILRPLRALIDPVTVLDMSEGMTREKLRMLKRIMLLVVSSFGPRERACHCGLLDRRRQFAQRSRVRKLQYIAELERNAEGLELSAQLQFLDQQNLILSLENKALKQRLDCLFSMRHWAKRLRVFKLCIIVNNSSSSSSHLLLTDAVYYAHLTMKRFTTEGDNKSPTIKALPPKGNPNWQFPSAMALLTYSSTIPFSSSSSSSSSSTSLSSRRFPATPFRAHVSEPLDPWRFRSRLPRPHAPVRAKATLTVDSPATGDASPRNGPPRVLLEVKDLKAVVKESGQEILRGVNLTIHEGEVHAIMGKNGSGKSTFSKVLVGHQDYDVTGGSVLFKDQNLLEMEPEERSHVGLFMSFQTPVEIPGVSNFDFLLMAFNARRKNHGLPPVEPLEFYSLVTPKVASLNMNPKFLDRNVNEGFSGGEKKRNEILQLAVLEADLAILDEIDSGLDVDALQDVAKAVNGLLTPNNSALIITHYQRLLEYIIPSYVHIMEDGMIVKTGDVSLAEQLEREGYRGISMS
ncbi:ABC transporter [Musa troglodytarum]|uniref:ABC transporter n=2 Tax=Musa troglodytarum TaxID=320322 RepID=A0A9E7I2B3_9LILI|nr:ABC transporter [Musa troglodytarum]